MSQAKGGRMVFTGIRGRDGGSVSTINSPDWLAAEVLNVELDGTCFGRRRAGHIAISTNNSFQGGGTMAAILVHVPAGDYSVTQIFGISFDTSAINRLPVNSPTWANLTLKDAASSGADASYDAAGCSFNSKFHILYNTAVDRSHVIVDGETTVRRLGLATSAAPTVADTGSGSYTATQRWYQQSYRIKSGSTVLAEGERSSSVAFTPSGSGTAAQVTKGTALSEGETHWVLWASADSTSGPFYEIAETAVGTTTYDDSAAPSTYSASTSGVAKLAGTFSTLPSTKFCVTVDNKVLFAGAYESGVNASRVWMTPTLGSLGRGDDERYLNTTEVKGYIDVEEGNGGIITALAILAGQAIVFKERQIWRFVATGDPVAPFTPRNISRSVGCINHRTVAAGVDDLGNPCLYFAAQDGPYRLGVNGLEYLGFDVEDVWATRSSNTAFGVFYGQKHQYYLAIASTSGNYVRLRFNRKLGRVVDGVIRGGWMKDSGTTLLQFQRGMALVPYSPGLTGEQTYVPRPHVLDTSGVVHRADDIYDDNGTAYSAYVETVPQLPAGPLVKFTTGVPGVIAYTDTSTQTLTVSQRKNYNTSSSDVTVSLNTTRRHLRVEEGGIPGAGDMDAIAFRVGDTGVTDNTWTVDALVVPWSPQEALTDL